ncbi:hypothetical protein [Erwinia pyrifoliae]|uniref:hypothetical protein n=1 Tax=Erwinia pyrifoliae TaxID=79967 RepID=UPI00384DA8FF
MTKQYTVKRPGNADAPPPPPSTWTSELLNRCLVADGQRVARTDRGDSTAMQRHGQTLGRAADDQRKSARHAAAPERAGGLLKPLKVVKSVCFPTDVYVRQKPARGATI